MDEPRRRWIAIACFASWALGPAVGIALAAHELQHHRSGAQDHSHAAQVAQVASAILHGHLHEADADDDHDHGLEPPSSSPMRRTGETVLSTPLFRALGPQSPDLSAGTCPAPQPAALSPPSPFGLCVLRL